MIGHTVSVLVEKTPDAIQRVLSLCWRRGFTVDSFAVGDAEEPATSRITLACSTGERDADKITRQLEKLVNVLEVAALSERERIDRELALVKVNATKGDRAAIMALVEILGGRIVDLSPSSLVVEVSGASEHIRVLQGLLRPYGIVEIARTGRVALSFGRSTESQHTRRRDPPAPPPPRHSG